MSDKISAVLGPRRLRRTKDLYDIFCLSERFSFNARNITLYIKRDIPDTTHLWDDFEFNPEILTKLQHAYSKLRVRNIKGEEVLLPDWSLVLGRFYSIAHKVRAPHESFIWKPLMRNFE